MSISDLSFVLCTLCSAGECGRTIYTSSSQAETHPNAVEPDVDYSAEPTALVVFSFEEVAQGVMLTITESGFEQIPPARGKAFTANEKGWSAVVNLVCPLLNGDPKILR